MAWPASQQTTADAFNQANRVANQIRGITQNIRNASAAGSIDRPILIDLMNRLQKAIDHWNASKAISGIVQYTKDQFDDQTMDAVAEFNAMVAAAEGLRDWIFTNFPKDATSGAWLAREVDAQGNVINLQFTSGQLSGFRTEADTFLATIS